MEQRARDQNEGVRHPPVQGYGLLGDFLLGSYPTPHIRILVIEWIRLSIVQVLWVLGCVWIIVLGWWVALVRDCCIDCWGCFVF